MFPLLLRSEAPLGGGLGGLTPNLSDVARRYLGRIGGEDEEVFYHALTMLHSPRLNAENAGALRMDWPRVPLPGTKEGLRASAMLGRRLAALLDPEIPVPGVTDGRLAAEMREIAALTVVDGSRLDIAGGELRLTAGWGRGGSGRAVMPGQGTYGAPPVYGERTGNAQGPGESARVGVKRSGGTLGRRDCRRVFERAGVLAETCQRRSGSTRSAVIRF